MSQLMLEMRDTEVQADPMRFRLNLRRAGQIMAYEISKTLAYKPVTVTTPLDTASCHAIGEQVVLGTIFRAGKYREKGDSFDILIEYLASPHLDGKTLILCDPMLATGGSMELSYRALLTKGTPAKVHVASVIASRQAVDYVAEHFPEDTTLWVGAIDDKINAHSYIVPGLGDAGDLAFGTKE